MTQAELNGIVQKLKSLITVPIIFQDTEIELLDATTVNHDALWESKTHHHPWFEFNYISDGSLYTTIAGNEFCAEAESSFLIPPGYAHSHTHYGKGYDTGICLRWKIDRASKNDVCFEKLNRTFRQPHFHSFNSNIELLMQGETHLQTQLSFVNWLLHVCEMWNSESTSLPVHKNSVSGQVIMYLNEYYSKVITVQDIASSLNMSYRSLSRNFKKETGITVIEKLNEIRIAAAKNLLISTDLPISEIATHVGFANEYYFSNTFKQYSAATPSGFRKNNKRKTD